MLKKVSNLEGARELTKKEQKAITGGLKDCKDPSTNACKYLSVLCAPPCRPPIEP